MANAPAPQKQRQHQRSGEADGRADAFLPQTHPFDPVNARPRIETDEGAMGRHRLTVVRHLPDWEGGMTYGHGAGTGDDNPVAARQGAPGAQVGRAIVAIDAGNVETGRKILGGVGDGPVEPGIVDRQAQIGAGNDAADKIREQQQHAGTR